MGFPGFVIALCLPVLSCGDEPNDAALAAETRMLCDQKCEELFGGGACENVGIYFDDGMGHADAPYASCSSECQSDLLERSCETKQLALFDCYIAHVSPFTDGGTQDCNVEAGACTPESDALRGCFRQ